MKKVISLLLALMMLMMTLPLSLWTATAQDLPTVQIITDIAVTIDEPVAGREANFEVRLTSLPAQGVWLYTQNENFTDYHNGISWYDQTDKRSLEEGDCFIAGHEYTVSVYVSVTNPFYYYLSAYAHATVNGNMATFTKVNDTRCYVNYKFTTCAAAPADVEQVTLGGILYPVAGQFPSFEVAIDEERTERNLRAGTAFTNGVAWYNSNTYTIMTADDAFEAGETYTLMIGLKAKGNYRFATENGESTVKGTINGFTMKNVTYQDNDDPSRYLKLKYEFTCKESDTIGGGAPIADIRIDYPVNGKRMSYEPIVYGQHCDVRRVNIEDEHFHEGVRWTNRTHGVDYPTNASFKTGSDHSVTILISAEDIFDDEKRLSYVLHEDGTVTPYLRAYVNGLPARVEPHNDISPAQTVMVTFDFPACKDTALTVDEITFNDLDFPIVGHTPDMVATIEYGYVENTSNRSEVVTLLWLEDGGRLMMESDPFLEGHRYYAVADLQADILGSFLMDDTNRFGGVVTAYGADEAAGDWYPNGPSGRRLLVAAAYTPFVHLPEPFDRVDIIGAVAPTVGQRACYSASLTEALLPFAQITDVTWHEGDYVMNRDRVFQAGVRYSVQYEITPRLPYSFAESLAFSVNGDSTPLLPGSDSGIHVSVSNGKVMVTVFYPVLTTAAPSGVTDYVEISDLMRPAPYQTPDFNVTIDSPYTQFGGVTWHELDDDGYIVKTLGYTDTFKNHTRYRAEIRVLPTAERTINLDARGATLNNEAALFYYLSGEAVVVYAEYDTSYCITDFNVRDVQYPIPGKTPDNTVVIRDDSVYDIGYIDWYYETNPGTASAGFSKLDGKFKADRRHQAYVELGTEDGYWFATDKNGKLAVNITFDYIPMAFAYSTDSYLEDGACNQIEAACTYEIASKIGGVFVGGMWLTDGMYMDNSQWGVQTEQTMNKTTGYAYYENGVLTLHDFMWEAQNEYNMIDSYRPLNIKLEGQSYLETDRIGIASNDTLTLTGDGVLELHSNERGIFAMDDVTVDSGTWIMEETKYEGMWLYSSLTVNGGTVDVYGKDGGLYGDDYPPVTINGGTVIARAADGYVIGWCDMTIAGGATVTVGDASDGQGAAKWDGKTDFIDYSYIEISFPSTPDTLLGDVTGDGIVNMMDVMALYNGVSGKVTLTDAQNAAGDMDANGIVNMMDMMALYNQVSGKA